MGNDIQKPQVPYYLNVKNKFYTYETNMIN